MIGSVTIDGVEIGVAVVGCSEVQNINGSRELHVSIRPILPGGPRGGEPLPKPQAA